MRPRIPERAARMAESVDALVSNTNDSNVVPVRLRLRVLFENLNDLIYKLLRFFVFLFWAKFGHFIELIAKI